MKDKSKLNATVGRAAGCVDAATVSCSPPPPPPPFLLFLLLLLLHESTTRMYVPNRLLHDGLLALEVHEQEGVQEVEPQEGEDHAVHAHPEHGVGQAVAAEHHVQQDHHGHAIRQHHEGLALCLGVWGWSRMGGWVGGWVGGLGGGEAAGGEVVSFSPSSMALAAGWMRGCMLWVGGWVGGWRGRGPQPECKEPLPPPFPSTLPPPFPLYCYCRLRTLLQPYMDEVHDWEKKMMEGKGSKFPGLPVGSAAYDRRRGERERDRDAWMDGSRDRGGEIVHRGKPFSEEE